MKLFDLRPGGAVVKRALEHHELMVAKQRYENHLEGGGAADGNWIELSIALEEAYPSDIESFLTAALET